MRLRITLAAVFVVFVVLQAASQEVVLPLDRFDKLRQEAAWQPTPTPTPRPPAPWALESAQLALTIGERSARVEQDLELTLYDRDWQDVALPSMGRLLEARLGKLEGRVSADSGWTLRVRGAGRHRVHLTSAIGVTHDENAARPIWSLSLPLPQAAVVRGTLSPPDDIVDVESVGDGILQHETKGPRWSFVGRPGGTLRINLLGRAVVKAEENVPPQLSVVSATLAEVFPVRIKARAWIEAEVLRGHLEELELRFPQGYEVATVHGDMLAGWRVEDDVLHLQSTEPTAASLSWEVVLDAPASDEIPSPVLVPAAAFRSLVAAAIKVEGDGVLQVVSSGSAHLADPRRISQLPRGFLQAARAPLILSDSASPPRWRILRPEQAEVLAAQVDRLAVDILLGTAGQAAYQLWAEVRSSGATGLSFQLPEGFVLSDAGLGRVAAVPGVSAAGLVLPLRSTQEPQVVHLGGLLPLALPSDSGRLVVPLPRLGAPVSQVVVRIVMPTGPVYTVEGGKASAMPMDLPRPQTYRTQAGPALSEAVVSVARTYAPVLFPVPPSHTVLNARWNALSPSPGPLIVEVKPRSARREWF
jgi:hypothetical protein